MHGNILYLEKLALPSHHVQDEPLIHHVHSRSEEKVRQGGSGLETQSDVLIRGLWEIHTDAITEVIFGDSEMDTQENEPMDKLLALWYKERNIITVITSIINGKFFFLFDLSGWHAL